jgi:hypothetical protein
MHAKNTFNSVTVSGYSFKSPEKIQYLKTKMMKIIPAPKYAYCATCLSFLNNTSMSRREDHNVKPKITPLMAAIAPAIEPSSQTAK